MNTVYSDVMLRLESERDEARTAAQVQAAQIAALKVDLAAMQKHRDEALASAEASENVAEQRRERAKEAERALEAMKKEKDEALSKIKNMEVSANSLAKMMQEPLLTEMDALVARAERDAALFDLSQARAELDRLHEREKHFAKALSVADGGQYRADWDGAIARLIAERDAAVKAREEAEASAATMRIALGNVLAERYRLGDFAAKAEYMATVAREAIDAAGTAGRALLDRHAAELAKLREENRLLRLMMESKQ